MTITAYITPALMSYLELLILEPDTAAGTATKIGDKIKADVAKIARCLQ